MEIRSAELGELQAMMVLQLREIYLPAEAVALVRRLFSHLTGLTPSEMVLEKKRKLTESEMLFLQRALKRLKDQEPLQYIIGATHFYGSEFKVSPAALIPRPETEELVDWIVSDHQNQKRIMSVLDIGTGSGCIAISLKKNLHKAEVSGIDISEEALLLAGENASSLDADITFAKLDILDEEARATLSRFDLIVSNPPYVTPSDREKMESNVIDHEPPIALFVDEDDPLLFYTGIIAFAREHLNKGGKLYFECNEGNAHEVEFLLKKSGFKEVELRNDMQGKERMLRGTWPGA